jgi:tetratricopeptide (TPR) repeat protein
MSLNRNVRRAGLILVIWLVVIIVSLVIVPRLPWDLPTWLRWTVAILLGTIGTVADLIGLFRWETPAGRSGGVDISRSEVTARDIVGRDKIIYGNEIHVQTQPPSPEPLTPFDLPPDLPTWTGREADTKWLLDQLRQDTDVVAITGMGGIGKSALAVHTAHQVSADDFPDGILWLDLRGAQLDVLLASVAAYYGQRQRVDTEPTLDRKAAVVRSILAGKRALLVLDNTDSSQQLDLLLPGEGPCVTIVTTRHRNLRVLRGVATRSLDKMAPDEAWALFVNILGRPLSEDEAGQVIILHELLEGLPLALDLAASWLREWRRPWLDYVGAVSDTLRSLEMLRDPEDEDSRSVRATLALSYDALDESQRVLFRALGVLHSPTFAPAAAAALSDVGSEIAHDTLDRLATLSLVEPSVQSGGRYRLHALLAAYARELLQADAAEAAAVAEQHAGYFLTVAQQYTLEAYNAGLWATYDADWLDVVAGADWALARLAGDGSEAAEWVNRYVGALSAVGTRRNRWLGQRWLQAGIKAAQMLEDQRAEAAFLNNLGLVYDDLGEKRQALEYHEQALSLRRQVGDRAGEATTLNNIGRVYDALGKKRMALKYYEQALGLVRQVSDRAGEAAALNNIGHVYSALGDKREALEYYEQALLLRRQVGDRAGEAATLNNIGSVYDALGEKQKALKYYEQVLQVVRQVGHRAGEATTLNNIGRVYDTLGERRKALKYYEQVLQLVRQVGNRSGEAVTLNNIGLVYDALGHKRKALDYYEQALSMKRQVGDRSGEAATLNNIGSVHDTLGKKQEALEYYEQALILQRQVGDRAGEAVTLSNTGRVYDVLGKKQEALEYYEQALELLCQVGDRWHESIARFNMAKVYVALSELGEAEEQLRQVVVLDEAIGHPNMERDREALAQVQALRRQSST